MPAAKDRVGLDIGSRFVKALQVRDEAGKLAITEFGMVEVDTPENAPQAVGQLFGRKNFKGNKRVQLGVSGRSVFVRYVQMSKMSDEELVNAARYELGKYIPIEVDEVIHDCKKLEEPAEGDAEMRVVLVAARRAFIDKQIRIVENADLYPNLIDVECFALGNAYEAALAQKPESAAAGVVALVDVGASKTNVVIVARNTCQFTREFYKGGDDITDVLSKKLGIEAKKAEALKRAPKDETLNVQGAVEDVLEEICQDVKISIDFFENQNDMSVDQVLLTGGGAATPGLQQAMERMVGKPLELWNPIDQVPLQLSPQSEAELRAAGSQSIVALGLAARDA
jgi:type IV pilus assembly protein PilM